LLLLALSVAAAASALEWKEGGGYRFADLTVPAGGKAGFTELAARDTGVTFTNVLTDERGLTNQILMSGSGVALGDVDGDGWCDVYFCGLDSPNALYRNLGGWKFQDITASAGVACADQLSTGAVFADVDGDGDLDLVVTAIGRGARLFLNDGQGRFKESTAAAGLTSTAGSMSAALADVDGDGDLDLYVANYRTSTLQDEPAVRFRVARRDGQVTITMIDGRPVTAAELDRYYVDPATMSIRENGEADVLYRNDGQGRFTPVPWTDGSFLDEDGRPLATPPLDWGYTAMFRDLNGDGAPDLYVCNDTDSPDRIWINDGRGRFQALARLAVRLTCLSSMGVDFADINRDGFDDFIVTDMLSRDHGVRHRQMVDRRPPHPVGVMDNRPQYMRNTLFLNRGDGTYAEIAQFAGVDASDWTWMPLFLDVDLDGFEDLLITTGLERSLRDADARRRIDRIKAQQAPGKREFLELRRVMPRLDTPNYAFRNRGDLTFADTSAAWGFNSRQVSHGLALADLDNDGDLDVAVHCLNAPPLLCRNDTGASRVAVRLKGRAPNTRGIGAKLRLTGGPVPQSQEMIAGGRYLSGDDALRVFAAGQAAPAGGQAGGGMSLEVMWRSGRRSVVTGLRPDRVYEIAEADAVEVVGPPAPAPAAAPWFKEVSELLRHVHYEEPFDDFARQPLLPRRLSQLGPGVCWGDFNGDGWEDLIVGCGRGGRLAVFANNGPRGFARVGVPQLPDKFAGDVTTVLNAPAGPGGSTLFIGVSSYETGAAAEPAVRVFDLWAGGVDAGPLLPGDVSSAGPLALADVEGDGDLDLFVGGRVIPGRYPEPATSRLYRREGAGFQLDAAAQKLLDGIGLVSGAVFGDLNEDGFPELVLACEWGPLQIFRNENGRFTPWDALVTVNGQSSVLSRLTGWWNSVTAGDLDGDGRLDLVAGNWGRNGRHQFHLAQPLRLFYGDANGDGAVQIVEAGFDPARGRLVPWRFWDTLSQAMPFLQERFNSFTAYSEAGVAELLGDRLTRMRELTVSTPDSLVFLNRGGRFEARPLPVEAQWAPVFGVNVADLDGDGHEDVFLAQNFFGVDAETSRFDAGRGLVLKGDGTGGLRPVAGAASGILVYGEQRGAALADFDADGRVDLAVTQNGAATKLYRNVGARPGVRVRLSGPAANPAGVGAVLRLGRGGQWGPAREVRAGAGYWSQDSLVPVMALAAAPDQLQVRWPGGKTITVPLPAGAGEVTVDGNGKVTAGR
jgi:hypothetical protein